MDLDLSQLRIEELQELGERVAREIAFRKVRKRHGGGLTERGSRLYRNPDNPSETWSGRGFRPAWVVRQLARGRRLESLAE